MPLASLRHPKEASLCKKVELGRVFKMHLPICWPKQAHIDKAILKTRPKQTNEDSLANGESKWRPIAEIRMNTGDEQHRQFLRLFTEHEPALRTFVRSLVPTRQDASEVMQDVAIILWEKIADFDPARDFRKWAFGVARYQALAFLRDRRRDRHVFEPDLLAILADEAIAAESRHDAQRESLDSCLKKLPKDHRELVLSAYAPGIRMDELALHLGRTPMSLYKALHRIRQALLDCVQREISKLDRI